MEIVLGTLEVLAWAAFASSLLGLLMLSLHFTWYGPYKAAKVILEGAHLSEKIK